MLRIWISLKFCLLVKPYALMYNFLLHNSDLVRGTMIRSVCDVVSLSMKSHPFDKEIQDSGSEILSVIGTGFHKQNGMHCLHKSVCFTYCGYPYHPNMWSDALCWRCLKWKWKLP